MISDIKDVCLAVIERAEAPLTISQIASAAGSGKKPGAKFSSEVTDELSRLTESSSVFEWPRYGASRIFWKRSLREAMEDAFVQVLDREALTLTKAAKPVSKLLRRVSEKRALAELKLAAPPLAAAKRVAQVALSRQSVVYFSFGYLERLLPAREEEASLGSALLSAVERLQSGPGNYVRIDHLRKALELRKGLDEAALALARQGKLLLTRYDGVRPLPDEEKWNYVEDEQGELFTGAALPLGERVL
jgi:hypothetical protein